MHILSLFNSRMQPEDLLIFSLKEHHLLYKIIVKPSFTYFLKGEIHVLNLNRISVIRIDSLLIFCISKLICRDQNKIYNFHLLTFSRLSVVRDKTTTNASSFVILGCRKSNNSCWLFRLLIGSRTWYKGNSCWSHFIFCKSNLKWKISTSNENLWLIFWFPLFRFLSFLPFMIRDWDLHKVKIKISSI